MKHLLVMFSLIFLMGCQSKPIPANPDAPKLITTWNTEHMATFSSNELDIQLDYPENWIVHDVNEAVFIAENETHFPSQDDGYIYPDYWLLQISPYLSEEQKFLGEMSAVQVANMLEKIAPKDSKEIVEPITQVNINGLDGATKLENNSICYSYSVFLSLNKDSTIFLSSCGPEDSVEEMKAVLNAIALSIQALEN